MAEEIQRTTLTGAKEGIPLDQSTILTAVGVISILMIMIFPLPTFLLDILLSLSITFSIVILLTSMYLTNPLDFSTYPSLLLLTTLYRLSLNIASTRLILLHGNEGPSAAGQVIQSFGLFLGLPFRNLPALFPGDTHRQWVPAHKNLHSHSA